MLVKKIFRCFFVQQSWKLNHFEISIFCSDNLIFKINSYFLFSIKWKRKREKYSRGLLSINLWKARGERKKENAKSITRATVHLSIQFTWDIKLSVNAWWRNRATPTGFFCSAMVDKWNRFEPTNVYRFMLRVKCFPLKLKTSEIRVNSFAHSLMNLRHLIGNQTSMNFYKDERNNRGKLMK